MTRTPLLLSLVMACAAAPVVPAPRTAPSTDYAALVNAPDRLPSDVALDPGRKPAQFLAFAGVQTGMTVADLGAGGGYTTELLARAVGPTGTVYGQNIKFFLE